MLGGCMSNIISGLIAISMVTVFLVFYAVKLHSVALWIIVVVNLACIVYDYIQSIRKGEEHI
jgi:hypothetical protein